MPASAKTIPGSLIIIGLETSGAAIIVPTQAGRARFTVAGIDEDGVYLSGADGVPHYLQSADPDVAREAFGQHVVVVREINLDTPGGPVEYPIEVQLPLAPGLSA